MHRTGLALTLNVVNKHIYVCRLRSDVTLSVNYSHKRFRNWLIDWLITDKLSKLAYSKSRSFVRCFEAISSMLHAGCGVGGRLAAELEFADGVICRDGAVCDVTWRENRCEPTSSLTVTLSTRCSRYERPHRSATLGKLRQFTEMCWFPVAARAIFILREPRGSSRRESPVGDPQTFPGDEVSQNLKQLTNIFYGLWPEKRAEFENFRPVHLLILDRSVSQWGLSDFLEGHLAP